MPSIGSAYRGPLVIIGLGSGFSVVGAVPVAITFSIGMKSSATIIGMGFVGFGFLLILPGLFWCIMVRTHSFKFWRRKRRSRDRCEDDEDDEEEATPALNNCNKSSDKSKLSAAERERERRWPPPYIDSPPLIITDHCASSDREANNAVPTATIVVVGLGNAAPAPTPTAVSAQVCSYDNENCQGDNGNDPVDNGNNFGDMATGDDVDNNNRAAYVTTAILARNSPDNNTHGLTAQPPVQIPAPSIEQVAILTSV